MAARDTAGSSAGAHRPRRVPSSMYWSVRDCGWVTADRPAAASGAPVTASVPVQGGAAAPAADRPEPSPAS